MHVHVTVEWASKTKENVLHEGLNLFGKMLSMEFTSRSLEQFGETQF